MVVGALTFLGGVLSIILPLIDFPGFDDHDIVYFIILAFGQFFAGALYFVYGRRANDGRMANIVHVLSRFVEVIGMAAIISGVCSTAASMYPDIDLDAFFAGAVSSIIVGLILIILPTRIVDGRRAFVDKAIWTILLIAFLVLFLVSLLEVIGVDNVVAGAIGILTYIFMIILLFDPEVEVSMGIRAEEDL